MPAYPGDRSAEITASLGTLPSGTPVSEVARSLMDLFTSGDLEPGTRHMVLLEDGEVIGTLRLLDDGDALEAPAGGEHRVDSRADGDPSDRQLDIHLDVARHSRRPL